VKLAGTVTVLLTSDAAIRRLLRENPMEAGISLSFEREPILSVAYKGAVIGHHRPDFIVEECVVVELKAVHALEPVFTAQVLTYLRVTQLEVGLLINFNVDALKFGIKRIVK